MKIFVDIRLLSRGHQSGVEEYTHNLVDQLIKLAPEHQWQLFYNGWHKKTLPEHWLQAKNVTVINWSLPNKIFGLLQPKIDRFVETDLIWSPHINLINHQSKTPRLLTIHDLSFIHYPHFFSQRHRLWHFWQKIKKQADQASHIITDSEFTKNDITETLKISPEKISVIYPGITTPNFEIENLKLKIPQSYILYLGTMEPRKNIEAIIKAFNIIKLSGRFPKLKLILAGRAGWLYQAILQEIKRSPYQSEIILWGSAIVEEKLALYRSAEAFIYPSFFEGFGFPPLEAQSNNCPVIASNRASLPEVLGQSALLVNPWRSDQLAAAIEEVLTKPHTKKRLIKNGQKNITRFNWQQCAAQLLKIFSGYASLL